jgi:hypothetical protein
VFLTLCPKRRCFVVVTNPKGLDDASSGHVVSRLTVNSVTPNSETGTQSWITLGKFRKLKPFPSQRACTTTSEQSEGCNTVPKELGGCEGKRSGFVRTGVLSILYCCLGQPWRLTTWASSPACGPVRLSGCIGNRRIVLERDTRL